MNPRNPYPTVDVVVRIDGKIVLIERVNEPKGWALPGGFIDYGETVEHAAVREVKEETGLDVTLDGLLGVYSDPERDPRQHNMSVVYVGTAQGEPKGGDDAARAELFSLVELPPLVFDHAQIIADYKTWVKTGRPVKPSSGQ